MRLKICLDLNEISLRLMSRFKELELDLSSSKTKILDCKQNLDSCESKLDEKIRSAEAKRNSVFQPGGIPQYGPTNGDRCISPGGDETGKYSMQYSIESYDVIAADCTRSPGNAFENLITLSKKLLCSFFAHMV